MNLLDYQNGRSLCAMFDAVKPGEAIMGQWNEWVVRTNLADFKRKLEIETNPDKRRILQELLRNEEAKRLDLEGDEVARDGSQRSR